MNKTLLNLFFLIFLISCQKNKDEHYPTLQIFSPGTNTSYNVLEPIPFKVTATDETHLERITIHLLNDQLAPVATPVTQSCSSNESTFEHYIITTDIHLSSGQYFIKAEAFDGTNKKVLYREIHLNEVPKALKKVYIVSQPSSSQIQIDSVSNGQVLNAFSLSSDYEGSVVNSYNQFFTIVGGQTGNLVSYEAEYFSNSWSISNPQTASGNYFFGEKEQNDKTFIANNDGIIKSYRKSSQPVDVINVGNQLMKAILTNNDFLLGYAENKSNGQKSILVHYLSSGVYYQSFNISTTIKSIFKLTDNEFLLIGNENNLGKILIYDLSSNSVSEPVVFSGGKIFDAKEIGNNQYLLAHDNGLTTFNSINFSLVNLGSGSTFQKIEYDLVNNQIYAAKNNSLEIYSLSPFSLISNSTATDSIVNLHLLYNK